MDDSSKQHLALAREHYTRHEYSAAEYHLREVLKYTRSYADVHNMLGVIHHDRGDFTDAQHCFESALQINRGYTEAALNLAVTYNDLGMYSEARRIYAEVTAAAHGGRTLDPFARGKIANLHAEVARAYEDLDLHLEAAEEYRRALRLCPDFSDLRTRLGIVLRSLGDLDGAAREFEDAVRQNPRFAPAWVSLGITYFALARRDDAERAWEGALAQEPDNKPAQMYLRMLRNTGNTSAPPAREAPGIDPTANAMLVQDITGEFHLSLLTDRATVADAAGTPEGKPGDR